MLFDAFGRTTHRRATMILRWLLVLVWAGVIWALSSIPELKSGLEQDFVLRKIAHGLEFAILAVLLVRALPHPRHGTAVRYLGALILAIEYAAIDEIHQGFVPGRQPSARDVAIDALGVVAGTLALYFWSRVRSGRKHTSKKDHRRSASKKKR